MSTTSGYYDLSLPPELWSHIISFTDNDDRKSCLFVSRLHHDIALSLLFSHLTLFFGMWRREEDGYHVPWTSDEYIEMERLNNVTWDILRHIPRAPDFAKVVKKLSVRAYSSGDGIFELRFLAEALQSLPNIRSFHWYGLSPLPNPYVLEALSKSSGSMVTDLRLPSLSRPFSSFPVFTNLRTLRVVRKYCADEVEPVRDFVHRAVEASMNTITHLSVCGHVIWGCPMRTLVGLYGLEIIRSDDLGGLTLVFRHCVALRSLTLCTTNASARQLFAVLLADPTALPDITAFKLICECPDPILASRSATLAKFLANKKRLRMLDVVLNEDPEESESFMTSFMPDLLPQLPVLEVLGMEMFATSLSAEDLRLLDARMPLRLTALLIVPEFYNKTVPQEWINLFRRRTSLKYLHILDLSRAMDLRQELLEDHPDSLELVGYGPYLRWIVHDAEDDVPRYSPCWSFEKVAHRTVEDFGCADWEWLLRLPPSWAACPVKAVQCISIPCLPL